MAKKLLLRNTKFLKEIGRRSSWSFLKGGLRSKPSTREKIEVIEMHGMKREDPFSWMNDTENASLKEYLLEEKLYCKSVDSQLIEEKEECGEILKFWRD